MFSIAALLFVQPVLLFSQAILPAPDHIVIVILENHAYNQIIGSTAAPHINALANDDHAALFTQSYAIEHPSQPNYLDLYSGCNQGITDDALPSQIPFTTDNLGSQLITGGYTFLTYSEDLPSVGFNGATSGNYARKHNPAANWMGTGINQIPITTNQPFTAFPSDYTHLPTVCYVVPNQNNDMHNGSNPTTITTGDTWVYQNLNGYIQWAKTHNSLLILTFDEDNDFNGNQIATIFSGQMVKSGKYSETINHYSILRTIEDIYGLSYACNASDVASIMDIWNNSSGVIANESISLGNSFSLYPNPFNYRTHFTYSIPKESEVRIALSDMTGKLVKIFQSGRISEGEHSVTFDASDMPSGSYILSLESGNSRLTKEIILTK